MFSIGVPSRIESLVPQDKAAARCSDLDSLAHGLRQFGGAHLADVQQVNRLCMLKTVQPGWFSLPVLGSGLLPPGRQ